ncbi:MAG: AI-2E family transporter [bacterium]|nr:AI-2E family transporter [bacterium]
MENRRLELIAFSALFIGISILVFFVFRPFFSILVLATVLSVLFRPLYEKLIKFFRGGKSFFACLLVIVALVFLIMPILFFGLQIFRQAESFFSSTQASQGKYIQAIQQNIDIIGQRVVPGFSFNISDSINKVLIFVSGNLGGLLSQTAYIFFQTILLSFTFFFFLRDGEKILASFISLSPFEKGQNKEIVDSTHRTITSVIRGTIFVGLIRWIFLAAGFYVFAIPNAMIWGSIGGIIGAVPGLGTPFVIIPIVLYLLFAGNIFLATGIGLFGLLVTLFIDNLLVAYFFGKGLDVPPLFVLFSILGGIFFFGPLGFIFGPIILSLFISATDMYKILVLKKLN